MPASLRQLTEALGLTFTRTASVAGSVITTALKAPNKRSFIDWEQEITQKRIPDADHYVGNLIAADLLVPVSDQTDGKNGLKVYSSISAELIAQRQHNSSNVYPGDFLTLPRPGVFLRSTSTEVNPQPPPPNLG